MKTVKAVTLSTALRSAAQRLRRPKPLTKTDVDRISSLLEFAAEARPNPHRAPLLEMLQQMPDEAFGFVLMSLAQRVWPDGLGGFQDDSFQAITQVKTEALVLITKQAGLSK